MAFAAAERGGPENRRRRSRDEATERKPYAAVRMPGHGALTMSG